MYKKHVTTSEVVKPDTKALAGPYGEWYANYYNRYYMTAKPLDGSLMSKLKRIYQSHDLKDLKDRSARYDPINQVFVLPE